jgi:hypothetical protein
MLCMTCARTKKNRHVVLDCIPILGLIGAIGSKGGIRSYHRSLEGGE